MKILGFTITKGDQYKLSEKAIVPPSDEGVVDTYKASGFYGMPLNIDQAAKNEQDLIKKYRDVSMNADVDMAIDDIVDEAIAAIEEEDPVVINMERIEGRDATKTALEREFKYILFNLLNFRIRGHEWFRRWYIDGRLYFQKVVDTAKPGEGIQSVRYIDPRKIKRVRNIEKKRDQATGADIVSSATDFYVFNDKGVSNAMPPGSSADPFLSQGVPIAPDAITFVPSGLADADTGMVLSYLHFAIKPANQLRMLETAAIIYRLARAPERRVFYIDTGSLPTHKQEQYVENIMNKYRNTIVFDPDTGKLRDGKKFMNVLEDYWLPRMQGGKGTEIDTLPGAQNLGEMGDIEYFQQKLYESLKVPISRMQKEQGLNFGKAAEISRDELKFVKFIGRLKLRFSVLFKDILKTQALLKGLITEEDWEELQEDIRFVFAKDAFYEETKKNEILKMRAETLTLLFPMTEILFPKRYLQKEVMLFTDSEIDEMEKELKPVVMIDNPPPEPKDKKE